MFKASNNKQINLFNGIENSLSKRKQKLLKANDSWHNIFFNEFVSQIDESIYSVLYSDNKGRPNSSIRTMIGMMILKEGQGWSDEQLFDECRFNIKMMLALGLPNLNDDVPVESTYYEFRRLLASHLEIEEEDLLKKTFKKITIQQVSKHGVSGKKIRLDSKLINSNIAKSKRLDLIMEGLRKHIKEVNLTRVQSKFNDLDYEFLENLKVKSTSNMTYPLSSSEKKTMLITLGNIIRVILGNTEWNKTKYYILLEKIYNEQYTESNESTQGDHTDQKGNEKEEEVKVELKNTKEISSSSIQSVHDPEAAYRKKGQGSSQQVIYGYHSNVTESCDPDDNLNLILDVETVQANVSEDAFLKQTVKTSQETIEQANGEQNIIEEVITDGGYDSIENRDEMLKDLQPQWSIAKMKGPKHRFEMTLDEQENLEVYDKKHNEPCKVSYSEKAKKYVLHLKDEKQRYISLEKVKIYIQHDQIKNQVNKESCNLRASAESTIHQMFHRLKKRNKTVYRGLIKCQWYVLSRAFWVNVVRISDKMAKEMSFFLILMYELSGWLRFKKAT